MGQWVGSGHITKNQINLELIEIIQFSLKICDLLRHPHLWMGGSSLHLNHLIESRVTNYDWPFGTLPFGLFGSNLDTRDLETYPRTYYGHF